MPILKLGLFINSLIHDIPNQTASVIAFAVFACRHCFGLPYVAITELRSEYRANFEHEWLKELDKEFIAHNEDLGQATQSHLRQGSIHGLLPDRGSRSNTPPAHSMLELVCCVVFTDSFFSLP